MKGNPLKLLIALAIVASLPAAADGPAAKRVAMSQLSSSPANYHGKRILLQGYLVEEGNGDILYPSEEAMNSHRSTDGVWVPLFLRAGKPLSSQEQKAYYAQIQQHLGRKVLLEGTFDANASGNLSCCSGSLTDVSHIEPVTSRQSALAN